MQVPFFSFNGMHPEIKQEMVNAFSECYDSNWFVLGKGLRNFEKEYAAYNDVNFSCGVANGLAAIILALKVLGIGEGDEIIVPSNTYIATWLAVTEVGATIVPVEPNPSTFNIDPTKIEAAITDKTKAIIPVHLYGQPCEMEAIMSIAKKHNLFVVEDNAQSQGAQFNNKKTGSFGDINAVSFYPGKNLGALGEAGAITTNSEILDSKTRMWRNYGSTKKYHNEVLGKNDRMDELQGYLLSVKLKHLDAWNLERNKIANTYNELLSKNNSISIPFIHAKAKSVFHQYIILTEQRDDLISELKSYDIGTLIHYPVPPHLQKAYAHLNYKNGDFPIAEKLANTMLSLPIYPGLSLEQIEYVCAKINDFFKK